MSLRTVLHNNFLGILFVHAEDIAVVTNALSGIAIDVPLAMLSVSVSFRTYIWQGIPGSFPQVLCRFYCLKSSVYDLREHVILHCNALIRDDKDY